MAKYECEVCGYVYDPLENENVPFENLTDDWICPLCGNGKDQFDLKYYVAKKTLDKALSEGKDKGLEFLIKNMSQISLG